MRLVALYMNLLVLLSRSSALRIDSSDRRKEKNTRSFDFEPKNFGDACKQGSSCIVMQSLFFFFELALTTSDRRYYLTSPEPNNNRPCFINIQKHAQL